MSIHRSAYTLDQLNALEQEAHALVAKTGHFHERFGSNALQEAFKRSITAHVEYACIASHPGHHAIEAHKRALFIQWYSVAEPAELSGIPGNSITAVAEGIDDEPHLNEQATQRIYELTTTRIESNNLDTEFTHMLAWYREVFGFYLPKVIPALAAADLPPCDPASLAPFDFSNRGLMGHYFNSMKPRPA